jgi:RNA polymerase sigma-70 factor, ECF subfamily
MLAARSSITYWGARSAMTGQAVIEQLAEHIGGLRRYAFALTGSQPEAEDLVQDTLVRAIAAARSFRAGGSLRAWLFSIMHNLFVSGVRRRRPPVVALNEEAVAVGQAPAQLIVLEVRDALAALARLPEAQRAALSLVALEDFSYEQAAKIQGIPLGTLMSRLARGRETLRQTLDGELRVPLRVIGGKQ